jgi:hypothetical protein
MISQPRNLYTRSETHPCRSTSTFNYYQDNEPPVLVSDDKMLENEQTLEGFSMYTLAKSNSDAVARISRLYYSLSARDLKVHQGYSDCIMGYAFVVVESSGDIHNTLQHMPYFNTRKKRLASLEDHISRYSNIFDLLSSSCSWGHILSDSLNVWRDYHARLQDVEERYVKI